MERFEPDRAVTAIAAWARGRRGRLSVGTRLALDGASIAVRVLETGRPARVDSFAGATGPIARGAGARHPRIRRLPDHRRRAAVGVIAASTARAEPFPADTEARVGDFTELVATAISNAQARADVIASRQRLLTAGDDARPCVVRDLHDGTQQRFVHAIITLELALRAFETDDEGGRALVAEALEHAKAADRELRELAHGLLPDVLTTHGLAAGVESIADGLHVPVDVSVPDGCFPAQIEATAYRLVAEALTNVAKHADARHANVRPESRTAAS